MRINVTVSQSRPVLTSHTHVEFLKPALQASLAQRKGRRRSHLASSAEADSLSLNHQ